MQKEYEEDMRRFTEVQNKIEILYNQERDVNVQLEKIQKEVDEQSGKFERAEIQLNSSINKA